MAMKYREPSSQKRTTLNIAENVARRQRWFSKHLTAKRALNIATAAKDFLAGVEHTHAFPTVLKVDISPLCNLRCTFCVHGEGGGGSRFAKTQRMSLDQFKLLVARCEGKVSAFSLYYLGDPMTHPDLNAMASVAREAGIYTHVSTNFSFRLSDEKIDAIAVSGIDHFKACLDGISQEKYELTRVGGRVDFILSNIERLVAARNRLGSDMRIEVQSLSHKGNRDELPDMRARMQAMGVDELTTYAPAHYTMDDMHPRHFDFDGFAPGRFPQNCYWPWLFMTVKYNGDVIPCCSHRQSEQYDPMVANPMVMGNVFTDDMATVWNSDAYRATRCLIAGQGAGFDAASAAAQYCYGCKKICKMKPHAGHVAYQDAPVLNLT